MAQPLSGATKPDARADLAITRFCQHLEFFANHPPLQVKPLASGETNLNYYVKTVRGEYVLRRYPSETLGVCRQQELRCQHAAAAAGLAPAPLCLNNHQQLLISEYIANGQELELTPTRLLLLAKTLATLHSLKVQTPILQVKQYLVELMRNSLLATLEPAASLYRALQLSAEQFENLSADLVLCHMDLHQGNMLWADQRIWLLDFEYSQLTDSSFDLAAVSLHFQLTEHQEQLLLQHYYAHRQFTDNQSAQRYQEGLAQRLQLAKILYSGFCWLWYQAAPGKELIALKWQKELTSLLKL